MVKEAKDDGIKSSVEGIGADRIYRVGTLTYTRMGLGFLFFWLLWGDFCYVLMESVAPSIIPLKLKDLDASNTQIGILYGTVPMLVYTCLNPIVSFKSDRHRSRWGRRIPFIMFTVPFLAICLVGLAFADRIGFWLHGHMGSYVAHLTPTTMAIWTLAAINLAFVFFNSFLSSVFWYLFNDVVPESLLARFMAWFRTISLGASALYNFCIFRYAHAHATEIFIGAALLYLVGFSLMCIFVKEGEYPPPPPYVDGETGFLAALKTYALECHFTPHYIYQWLITGIGSIGGAAGAIGSGAMTAFGLYFYLAIGVKEQDIGDIFGTILVTSALMIMITGWLADRYHPIRVVMAGAILGTFVMLPANIIWFFWHPDPRTAYWACMVMAVLLMAPANALNSVYDPPFFMRLFPRSRYGQFCSTNAIWRSIGGMIGGGLSGPFLDFTAKYVGKEQTYFYVPLWQMLFGIPSFYFLIKLYQSWKKHGGDDSYVPPVRPTNVPPPGMLASPLP